MHVAREEAFVAADVALAVFDPRGMGVESGLVRKSWVVDFYQKWLMLRLVHYSYWLNLYQRRQHPQLLQHSLMW